MQQLPPSQQQQQQQQSMVMPPFPPASITTEQIQKYLDENKKLILAILDNQNLGKLAECAQYQAQLQKNLMYLAAIADAQPQAPAMPSQVPTHPGMQQGGHYMQHPHAGAMGQQQPSGFPAKMPMQFNAQHMQEQQQRLQQLHQQHQQQAALHSPFGLNPGVGNGMQGMHNEVNPGGSTSGGLSSTSGIADFSRAGANGGGAGVAGAAPDGASGGGAAAGVITPAGAIGGANSGAAGGGVSGSSMDMRGSKQDGVESGSGDPQGKAGNSNANGEQSHATGSEDA